MEDEKLKISNPPNTEFVTLKEALDLWGKATAAAERQAMALELLAGDVHLFVAAFTRREKISNAEGVEQEWIIPETLRMILMQPAAPPPIQVPPGLLRNIRGGEG
jgi:hypothetical protein